MGSSVRLLCVYAILLGSGCVADAGCGTADFATNQGAVSNSIDEEMLQAPLSRSVRNKLRDLASQRKTREAAMGLVNAILAKDPGRADLAAAKYMMLMAARDYDQASRAAEQIVSAACKSREAGNCSESERRIFQAYSRVWSLRARAKAFSMENGESKESFDRLMVDAKTLVTDAHAIEAEQGGIVEIGLEGVEARALVLEARSLQLSLLEESKQYEQYIREANTYAGLCPKYQDDKVCWDQWSVKNAKLGMKGLSLIVGAGLEWTECSIDFDLWRTGDQEVRGRLVEQLVYSRVLLGKSEEEVATVLGSADGVESHPRNNRLTYLFRPSDAAVDRLGSKVFPPDQNRDSGEDRSSSLIVVVDKRGNRVSDAWIDWYTPSGN